MKLNNYRNFAGNTEEAFNFYRSVFGGDFTSVVRFKDKFGVMWMVSYAYPGSK